MYSFGYVLWELWYGETAFRAAFDSRTEYQVLEDVVKQNLRPTHIEGTRHPWGNWQYIMASCWNKDPKLRLTAQKRGEQLQPWRLSREYITATRIYESFITTTTTTNPKAFNAITTITTPKSSSLLGPKRNQSQTRKSPKGLLFHIIVKPKTGMCILSKKGVGNGIPITST